MLSSSSDFKTSIKNIVVAYKRQHPEEYDLLCQAVAMQRKLLLDPKYATSPDAGEGSDQRGLYEISETLQGALVLHLSDEATTWLKTTEGGRWFADTFAEFRLPQYV